MLFGSAASTTRLFARAAAAVRSRRRVARGARLALSWTVTITVLALIVLHAAIFWDQAGDGRLFDPATAARWGIGAFLVGAMVALRRAGVPVFWGRRALVAWVLVALLHWTAVPGTDPGYVESAGAQAAQVVVDLPIGAAGILTAVSVALLLLIGVALTAPAAGVVRGRAFVSGPARAPLLSRHLASRAPPVFA